MSGATPVAAHLPMVASVSLATGSLANGFLTNHLRMVSGARCVHQRFLNSAEAQWQYVSKVSGRTVENLKTGLDCGESLWTTCLREFDH